MTPTTPPRTEGAGLMDGLREAIHAAVKGCNKRRYADPTEERGEYWMTDRIAAAVRAYDAAHPPQPSTAPQPVPVVATGAESAYECRCCLCYAGFIGDKRAVVCPTCIRVTAERAATIAAAAPGATAAQATVPGGGRDLAADVCLAMANYQRGQTFSHAQWGQYVAAELQRLGWVHGGARLSDEARETIVETLHMRWDDLIGAASSDPETVGRLLRVRAEIEALPRV